MKDDFDFRIPPFLFRTEVLFGALQEFQDQNGIGSIRRNERARELYQAVIAMYGMQLKRGMPIFLAIPQQDPPDYYASLFPEKKHEGYWAFESKSITNWNRGDTENFSAIGLAERINHLGSGYVFQDPTVTLMVHFNFDAEVPIPYDSIHKKLQAILPPVKNAIWIFGQMQDDSWYLKYLYPGLGDTFTFHLPEAINLKISAEEYKAAQAMIDERISTPK